MAQRIDNFLLRFDKRTDKKQLLVWANGAADPGADVDLGGDISYIIGYKYDGSEGPDGEYIVINKSGDGIQIQNDRYACCPVYIYEDPNLLIISSSIREILLHSHAKIIINGALLYDYFSFGYLPIVDDTIYKNVRTLQPRSAISINKHHSVKSEPLTLFTMPEGEGTISYLAECLHESIRKKIARIPLSESVLFLTGGYDTLLGMLEMKASGYHVDTATWGNNSDSDITEARFRHNLFSSKSRHFETIIDNIKVNVGDLEYFSDTVGGLSTLASIYLIPFTREMVRLGKIHQLYCDYFEVTRRSYSSIEDIREKYTTDRSVVKKYFLDLKRYDQRLTGNFDLIRSHYKNDYPLEFHFYDRCVKEPFYKNMIIRRLGAIKYTLSVDHAFIRYNHSYIRKHRSLTYNSLLEDASKKLSLDIGSVISRTNADSGHQPYDARSIIYNNKEYFISILESHSSKELREIWDIGEMRNSIYNNTLIKNEEWFILRLVNLLIFKNKHKIGIK
ncbi:hypothetical protein ACFL42_00410 [Candidatus Omnitrophota bacterium]